MELSGEVNPAGREKQALQVISAVLLTDCEVEISNIPDIQDVNILIEMLGDIGVKIRKTAPHTYVFKADDGWGLPAFRIR